MFLAAALVTLAVFFGQGLGKAAPLVFILIPVPLWPAVRASPLISTWCIGLMSSISLIATMNHLGPFSGYAPGTALLLLQLLMFSLTITTLVVAATLQDQRRALRALAHRGAIAARGAPPSAWGPPSSDGSPLGIAPQPAQSQAVIRNSTMPRQAAFVPAACREGERALSQDLVYYDHLVSIFGRLSGRCIGSTRLSSGRPAVFRTHTAAAVAALFSRFTPDDVRASSEP